MVPKSKLGCDIKPTWVCLAWLSLVVFPLYFVCVMEVPGPIYNIFSLYDVKKIVRKRHSFLFLSMDICNQSGTMEAWLAHNPKSKRWLWYKAYVGVPGVIISPCFFYISCAPWRYLANPQYFSSVREKLNWKWCSSFFISFHGHLESEWRSGSVVGP